MKLFEIAEEFNALYELANEIENEEEQEELKKLFNSIEGKLEEKADNTRVIIEKLKNDAEFLKKEADRLLKKKRALENSAEKLKELLAYTLQSAGLEKLKTKKATFYFKYFPKVEVEAPEKLPKEFVRVKIEPDKKKLKEALENNITIEGVKLNNEKKLIIR